MKLGENIRIAWEGLRANKMRALLTMLGIIIGIGSVIAILTVGEGLSGTITDSMSSLGATNIMVFVQTRETAVSDGVMTNVYADANDLITDEMLNAARERFGDQIQGISLSESVGNGRVRDGRKYANVSISGVNTDYLTANNVELLRGRSIEQRDMDGNRNVAVVSDKLVNNMFGGDIQAALGQEMVVSVNQEKLGFVIIGVYKYEQNMMNFSMASDKDISTGMYIPVTTAKKMVDADDGYWNVTVMANPSTDTMAFSSQLSTFLNRFYDSNQDFMLGAMSMESILDQMNSMMDTVSIALSVIAGISLLVGGIGVMNIMLVSVTERTREIGTRKAMGATNGDIRMQFVVESTIVCLIGGVLGIIFGGILGYVGSSLLEAPTGPTLSSIVIAVGFSMAIGIFFGYYPANKAAKLDPIEALRYE
ncbi:MAG: ABC transporter permease [Eubacteriales bacterium]|nr:ABC transporter permease [Eubacteriales bacterium]